MAANYIVYGRKSCQFCKRAMDLIGFNGQKGTFVELSKDANALAEMIHRGIDSFPVVVVSYDDGTEEFIGGYDDLVKWFKR